MSQKLICRVSSCHNNDKNGVCHLQESPPMENDETMETPPWCGYFWTDKEWENSWGAEDDFSYGRDTGKPWDNEGIECEADLCSHTDPSGDPSYWCQADKVIIELVDGKAICKTWKARTGKDKVQRCSWCETPLERAFPDVYEQLKGK